MTQQKKQNRVDAQIDRDEFDWDPTEQNYHCPAGYCLDHNSRGRKQRHGGRLIWEHRYQCSPSHRQRCPLASRCCQNPARGRTIKRLEGQELLDAQREKMNEPSTKQRYLMRGQTVERSFGDAKGDRRLDSYYGRGLYRARTEIRLRVLAQNLMILDRFKRNAANHH